MKVMETERLFLRPFTLEDVDGVYQEIYSGDQISAHETSTKDSAITLNLTFILMRRETMSRF